MSTTNNDNLSRQGSRTPLIPADDTNSLTSFPDPTDSGTDDASVTIASPVLAPHLPPPPPLIGLLDGTGPSMFDEPSDPSAVTDADISMGNPQTLATAPADVIHRIIHHRGAVDLIRRLSSLLAERDAHVSALIRLAEEYRIPADRISSAATRAKQVEGRKLSLAAATASEDEAIGSSVPNIVPPARSVSERSSSPVASSSDAASTSQNYATIRGFTKLFGGTGKRRESVQITQSPASSRSASRSQTVRARPVSLDVRSITSNDSSSWATALFGGGSGGGGSSNGGAAAGNGNAAKTNGTGTVVRRKDSRSVQPREPVEMSTRHDRDQLPPTLVQSGKEPQDPQEAEWNKYLLRLAKHRESTASSGGDDGHNAHHSGELIGFSRFGTQGHAGKQKLEQLTRLVVGGIPMQLRHAIWMELSNTLATVQPDAYRSYLDDENHPGNPDTKTERDQSTSPPSSAAALFPSEIDAILKDVPRTLTSKYDFYADKGHDRLKRVLVAFVRKYPGLGYTQGLNMIAGYLLLAIPDESDAFWLLCTMVDEFFPAHYFARDAALSAPLADNVVLRSYVRELLPRLADRLDALEIAPEHTVPLSWFLTAYASVLPATALLRVWDVWLCLPGHRTFLLNVALALLCSHARALCECATQSEYFAYIGSRCRIEEDASAAEIQDLIRAAFMYRKKLEGVEVRRAWEMKKLRVRKNPSTEALYTPETEEAPAGASGDAQSPGMEG